MSLFTFRSKHPIASGKSIIGGRQGSIELVGWVCRLAGVNLPNAVQLNSFDHPGRQEYAAIGKIRQRISDMSGSHQKTTKST